MAGTRTEAACNANAAKFDWDAHNAAMDAGMAKLADTLAILSETEAQIAAARVGMVRDLQAMLVEAFK